MFTLFYERYLEYSKNKIYNFHESVLRVVKSVYYWIPS